MTDSTASTEIFRGKETLPIENSAFTNLRDSIAFAVYGITASAAIAQSICVSCKDQVTPFRDELSVREYHLSGLCQHCQDAVFDP